MSIVKANGAGESATNFYNGQVTTSLRLPNDNRALTRAYGTSPTSSTTMSFGGWFKITRVNYANVFSATLGGSGVPQSFFAINDDEKMLFQSWTGSANVFHYITTQVFRDQNSWYHFWFQIDTTDGTAADRVKIYVNGERVTAFDTAVHVAGQNDTIIGFNQNYTHYFGHTNGTYGMSGYLADWWFLDGQDVSPVDTVGEFKNGIFIPKSYSATFGNKGWHLEFKQTGTSADASGIGADTSGVGNHWTVSSEFAAHDSALPDSPENNWAKLNPLMTFSANPQTFSECNLEVKTINADPGYFGAASNFGVSSGKWYAEFRAKATSVSGSAYLCGVSNDPAEMARQGTTATAQYSANEFMYYSNNGNIYTNGSNSSYGNSYATGDVIGVALDLDNNKLYFSKNGTFQNSGDPTSGSTGTGAVSITADETYFFVLADLGGLVADWSANFGQDSSFAGDETATSNSDQNGNGTFHTAPPSGYLSLCSANLPESDISPNKTTQAVDHHGTLTYTSDGNAVNIVSGANDNNGTAIGGEINSSPDWVWIKRRNASNNHQLFDTNRGTNVLVSNENGAESDYSSYFAFLSSSNGFRLPAASVNMNANGGTYVAWLWRANGGTTVTNDASATGIGSIDSVYQANTTSGFSIVTYTGSSSGNNGTASTVAHGLGAVPKWIWFLPRDAYDGCVYHAGVASDPATDKLLLHTSSTADSATAASDDSGFFNDTEPTSTVFSIGTRKHSNSNGGMVAYCFAEVEGFSKFGSYIGNGSTDGPFVYLGFKPSFLMIKRAVGGTGNWIIHDDARDPNNEDSRDYLYANLANAQGTDGKVDFLSNGFKQRSPSSYTSENASGSTYVYMSFAKNPFKYSTAI